MVEMKEGGGESNVEDEALSSAQKNLGSELKKLREERGQTIKDLVHLTRISPPFIEALENNDISQLPGEIFGRGFIRNICKVLETDDKLLLMLYERCWQEKNTKSKHSTSLRKRPREKFLSVSNKKRSYRGQLNFLNAISLSFVFRWFAIPVALVSTSIYFWLNFSWEQESKSENVSMISSQIPVSPVTVDKEPVENSKDDLESIASNKPELGKETQHDESQSVKAVDLTPAATAQDSNLGGMASTAQMVVLKVLEPTSLEIRVDSSQTEERVVNVGIVRLKFENKLELFVRDTKKILLSYNNSGLSDISHLGVERRLSFVNREADPETL